MRTEDEIRKELEHIDELEKFSIELLLQDVVIRTITEEEMSEELRTQLAGPSGWIEKAYEDEPEKRGVYLLGLMHGRHQALAWSLGESNELYKDW